MYQGPGIYQHYKGKLYYVLGLSMNSETSEVSVVHRPLYDTGWPGLMHRPRNTPGVDSFDDLVPVSLPTDAARHIGDNMQVVEVPRFTPHTLFQEQQPSLNITVQSPARIEPPLG